MKKKIVAINTLLTGSTGGIMRNICKSAEEKGFVCWTATSYRRKQLVTFKPRHNDIIIGNAISLYSHSLLGRITGLKGYFSVLSTLFFIQKLKRISPNVIHLHNLHDSYINLPILFHYIKSNNIKVIWTLHDCWAFTGRCPYFGLTKCYKWKTGCHDCKYPSKAYPKSYMDATRLMWKKKKKWFTGVKDMTIVTPSRWLAELVQQSYLREYNIMVINNGIDLNVFKPCKSNLREKYNIKAKYIILGVAAGWEKRKGIDFMIRLANDLGYDYQVILVGTTDTIDLILPKNIISIHHTENQEQLAEIYAEADVFVNPTREDNFPTVNLEALACGTPIVTFNTGGSPESVKENTGIVVEMDNYADLYNAVIKASNSENIYKDNCRICAMMYSKEKMFEEYIKLYGDIKNEK